MTISSHPDDEEGLFEWGGYLQSRNQITMHDPISLRQRLRLELNARPSGISGFGSAHFDYDPAAQNWGDHGDVYRASLHEAYLTLDSDRFDLYVGKKLVRWGAADVIRPLDLVNPLDVRDPIENIRWDVRVPVWLVDGRWLLPWFTLEALYIPRAGVSDLPKRGSPWEPRALKRLRREADRGTILLAPREDPDQWFANGELGLRLSFLWHGMDLDVIYFRGYSDVPVFSRSFRGFGALKVTPEYPSVQTFGFALAKGYERSTLRAEMAFKPDHPFSIDPGDRAFFSDDDGVVDRDFSQWVLGFDRTFLVNLYVNLQVFWEHVENGTKEIISDTESYGLTFEVSDRFLDDDWTVGVRGVLSFNDGAGVREIFSEYRPGDRWAFSLGIIWFEGPSSSSLGQYDANDMLYFIMKRTF
jgi:hypothetical protein